MKNRKGFAEVIVFIVIALILMCCVGTCSMSSNLEGKQFPETGDIVITKQHEGVMVSANPITETFKIRLDSGMTISVKAEEIVKVVK